MKKFWEKYKVLIIVVLAIGAFLALSFLNEGEKEEVITSTPYESVSTWVNEVKEKELAITIIALSYCSHCEDFNPVISTIAKSNSIPIYWLEMDTLSESDSALVTSSFAFTEYSGSSPYMAITSKGEVLGQRVGGMQKEETISYLKELGVIE